MDRTASNRGLARQLGVSETAVRRAEKAGRIKRESDGSWDLAKVRAAWAGNTDPAQQRGEPSARDGSRRAARRTVKPVPEAALGAVRDTLREHGEPIAAGAMTFMQARTANEVLKAQERRLRLQQMKGELVDRAKAVAQVFRLARDERDAWVNWPARVAASAAEAKEIALRQGFAPWIERVHHQWHVPWTHIDVDPGDVVTIALDDGRSFEVRILKVDIGANLELAWDTVVEESSSYDVSALTSGGLTYRRAIAAPTPATRLLLADSPLLADGDDTARRSSGLYWAMGGIGQPGWTGGVLFGRGGQLSDAPTVSITPVGRDLMPYAPVHLASNGASWGTNITLSWVRQTRLGGAWVDSFAGTVVAEDQEEYALEILDGPGGTVLRTATGITAASFVYTTAMQSADFGGPQTALTFRVYQISAQVGRGFPSEDTTVDVT